MSAPQGIAIIGMAGRFPKAANVRQYWENLLANRECFTVFSDEEIAAAGMPAELLGHERLVRTRGVLGNVDQFDAGFFGFGPREAETTDPQQRLFIETAWEALENAGYVPETCEGPVGVFGGCSLSDYFLMLHSNPALMAKAGRTQVDIGNDLGFLTTRTAYKLNLRGPALSVNTACSTSLVSISLACQSLLTHQCDMALAGGVSVQIPEVPRDLYQDGGIGAPDGHCRAFDADARGTVSGNGVGVVALKRLEDALAAGDNVIAVIRGYALNNDGAHKVGFTAPSAEGQAAVICEALAMAGVEAESVSYVEAHGTGTSLGDPIEVEALTRAYRCFTEKKQFCAIGSVKTNIGHTDAAAGVAGLIKAALSVQHGVIPASLHYRKPNPAIDFESSPFFVNGELRQWTVEGPRRAGVSSFGIGGTNAHVVLEQAPERAASSTSRSVQLLTLSARSEAALGQAALRLAEHLEKEPTKLADAAYTLALGRRAFPHRLAVTCTDSADAVKRLRATAGQRAHCKSGQRPVALLLGDGGSARVGMGRELYDSETVFRDVVDRASVSLQAVLGLDLRLAMFSGPREVLEQPRVLQSALYVLQWALLKLWESWGVQAQGVVGYGLGEWVAATHAGVWTEEDGWKLAAFRGRVLQRRLEIESLEPASRSEALGRLREELIAQMRQVKLTPTQREYVSCATGSLARPEVTQADHWWNQIGGSERFVTAVRGLAADQDWVWLELGTDERTSARLSAELPNAIAIRNPGEPAPDLQRMTQLLGRLWVEGANVDWKAYYSQEQRHRVPLPTYPFERQRYWIQGPKASAHQADNAAAKSHDASAISVQGAPRPVAPAAGGEAAAIIEIWKDVLGVEKIAASDSFFDLGGDSVLAIHMAQRLEAKHALKVPLARFLADPTVEGLARIAKPVGGTGTRREKHSVLAPMRTTGSRPPFFAVHPVGGGCFIFRHLMERLGPDQPFYGLQAPALADLGESGDAHASFEAMAASYVEAIRTVQPHGPYFLGGLSWGGALAFEMAQQLQGAGEEVSLVALLDTPSPQQLGLLDALDDTAILVGLARDLAFQRGIEVPFDLDQLRLMEAEPRIALVMEELKKTGVLLPDMTPQWMARQLRGWRSRIRFVRDYAAKPYAGRLTFFRAAMLDQDMVEDLKQTGFDQNDPVFGWERLSSEPVEVFTIPGNHSQIVFEPGVKLLAKHLEECISRAERPAPGSLPHVRSLNGAALRGTGEAH